MGDEVRIEVIYDFLPELAKALPREVSKLVRKAAFDIQATAGKMAPVDTGFLKSSIYVVTSSESTYQQGTMDPPPGAEMLDEVDKPRSSTEAVIAVGANYGVYQELGTVNQPAQPYLTPAAELVMPQFVAALTRLEDLLKL